MHAARACPLLVPPSCRAGPGPDGRPLLPPLPCAPAGRFSLDLREFWEKDGQMLVRWWRWCAAGVPALLVRLPCCAARPSCCAAAPCTCACASVPRLLPCQSANCPGVFAHCPLPSAQPGKKGIALTPDEWDKLCAAEPQISQRLQAGGGGGQASGPAAAAAAAGGAGGAAGRAAAAPAAGPAAAAPGGGAVELSGTRRADVSAYKGTIYVNIREYYEKASARGCMLVAGLGCAACLRSKLFAKRLHPGRPRLPPPAAPSACW